MVDERIVAEGSLDAYRSGHLDTADRAQAATEAVLETLGETLTGGEAEDVAAQLPDELAGLVEDADHDLDPLFEGVTIDRENA